MALIGFISAFFLSIFGASNSIITQKFKIDPPVLALYRGFGIAIVLLPFIIFVEAPKSWLFYLYVVLNGLISSFSFRRVSQITEEHGANIVSKFLTIPPVFVAVAWWVINPVSFANFVHENPSKAFGSMFCLAGMLFSIFALERNRSTHKAVISALPIFLSSTLQILLCYFALQETSIIQGMFYYPFIQGLLIGIFNYFLHVHHLHNRAKEKILQTIFDKKVLKGGLFLIISVALYRVSANIALKTLPNPSYASLIQNSQILWVYLASQKLHLKDVISPKKGVILMIYAITFIILTY